MESGEKVEKEYFYVDDYLVNKEKARTSSGCLGGQVKYYFDDYQVEGTGADKDVKRIIRRFSSQSVLPACINSSGNHIGYSEVLKKDRTDLLSVLNIPTSIMDTWTKPRKQSYFRTERLMNLVLPDR